VQFASYLFDQLLQKFEWQKGYEAFTYSRNQIDTVIKYILTQEEYHLKKLFKEEYLEILEMNNVDFKEEYLFEFFNDCNKWN
jgi:putative transposase